MNLIRNRCPKKLGQLGDLQLIALAASAGFVGITGLSIWTAIVMAAYIVGLSYIARHESLPTALRYWPCIFLAAPVVLALIVNRGSWLLKGVLFSTVLVVWIFQALRNAYWTGAKQVGRCVSGSVRATATPRARTPPKKTRPRRQRRQVAGSRASATWP